MLPATLILGSWCNLWSTEGVMYQWVHVDVPVRPIAAPRTARTRWALKKKALPFSYIVIGPPFGGTATVLMIIIQSAIGKRSDSPTPPNSAHFFDKSTTNGGHLPFTGRCSCGEKLWVS